MKIAIWHNLPSGGGKRALFHHVKGLKARGHLLESWCPPTADQCYLPLSSLIKEHIIELRWSARNKQNIFSNIYKPLNFIKRIHALDRQCKTCASIIDKNKFDVLLANSSLHISTPSIGRYVSIPSVVYLQEPYRYLYEALPKLPWVALDSPHALKDIPKHVINTIQDEVSLRCRRYQAREELNSAKAFNKILVNSLYSRESVLRAYGLDATVCYLGVDTNLFSVQSVQKENIVIGLGAIRYEKNIKFIIDAVSLVKINKPKLVWIANSYIERYLHEVKEHALTKNVELIIKINIHDEELVKLLNIAQILLYAPRLEPFGYAPLEANACGVPVIAVAEGGVRETVINELNGLVVQNAPKEMADAILRLSDDEKLRTRLGNNGRDFVVQKWSLENAIDNIEKNLLDLTKS